VKAFRLQKRFEGDEPEWALQLIDISQKMLSDSVRTEQKYMTYMNATISHEMRNPLNSIYSQLSLLRSVIEDLSLCAERLRP